jgi:hypothetical protein
MEPAAASASSSSSGPRRRRLLRLLAPATLLLLLLLLLEQAQEARAFQRPSSPPSAVSTPLPHHQRPALVRTHAAAAGGSIAEAVNRVRSGAASAVEGVKAALGRIQAEDGRIGAFLAVSGDKAVAAAAALDAKLAKGDAATKALPLLGLPVAVKDNICTAGVPTTAASRVLEGYVPSYDATSVARLVAAGAVVVGKTNMDEFGMGSTTETSGYHVTRNPRDETRSPGVWVLDRFGWLVGLFVGSTD